MLDVKKLLLEKDFTINSEWEENDWTHFDEGIKFDNEYQVIKQNYTDGTVFYILLYNTKVKYNGLSKKRLLNKIKRIKRKIV